MTELAGKPQTSKSRTEKAKVKKDRAEKTDTLRVASIKSGSSRENAGVRADDAARVNSGVRISAGAKAQTGARANTAVRPGAVPVDFAADPTSYVNRELSQLEFNYRVLSGSRGKNIPLSECLKFLDITASNLDELYMVGVASLKGMVHAKHTEPDIAGLTPQEQLDRISERTYELVEMQRSTYNHFLMPTLRQNGLHMITEYENVTEEEVAHAGEYSRKNVHPVLTPVAFDLSRPLPLIRNKTLSITAFLRKKSGEDEELGFAMMQTPSVTSRVVKLLREIDEDGKERKVAILLEEVVERNVSSLFLSYDIVALHLFHIMRNAGLTIDEEEAVDLLGETQKRLKRRQWDEAIRSEIKDSVDKRLLKIICRGLPINSQDIFEISDSLDLMSLMKMHGLGGFGFFKTPRCVPQPMPALINEDDMFTNIRKGDILLHHPYQSLDLVINFVHSAARGQSVLVIKQALYRISGNSPIIATLAGVADNGRQVSVLAGLKARFDGENNINWAKMLKKAGCHVIYGLVGLKTHNKITLVIRMEEDGIRHYIHLSIGNYDDSAAKLYTDRDILTCNPQIGKGTTAVFNMLSDYSKPLVWNKLSVAPPWLRGRLLHMVHREVGHARGGRPIHIMAKINSLRDKEIIIALCEASCTGVKVEMIIRGICYLKAGISGFSEDISVHSIVGNFLEHSRTFCFFNGASPKVCMSNADWMPRNLGRRVEIMFPVEGEVLREKVIHALEAELEDGVKAHILQPDGSYEKEDRRGKIPANSQEQFCREAILMARESADQEDPARSRVSKPVISSN